MKTTRVEPLGVGSTRDTVGIVPFPVEVPSLSPTDGVTCLLLRPHPLPLDLLSPGPRPGRNLSPATPPTYPRSGVRGTSEKSAERLRVEGRPPRGPGEQRRRTSGQQGRAPVEPVSEETPGEEPESRGEERWTV